MANLLSTIRGAKLHKFEDYLPLGNMAYGIDTQPLTQSSEGFHVWDDDIENLCGDLVLDFNIHAFGNGEVVTIELYFKDEMTISFRSADYSVKMLPKCLGLALKYIESFTHGKTELVLSILLTLVGDLLFEDETGDFMNSYERAVELYSIEQSEKP